MVAYDEHEHEHDTSVCGWCLDLEKRGAHVTAEKLLAIAKTGQHHGDFGWRTLEAAAAQEILMLWERVRHAEARVRWAELKRPEEE